MAQKEVDIKSFNQNSSVLSKYIDTCEISPPEFKIEPFALVIFGGAGDLSKRKFIPTAQ